MQSMEIFLKLEALILKWDIREKRTCRYTFKSSDSSTNCVGFLSGRLSTLPPGNKHSSIKLLYLRAEKKLGIYKKNYSDKNSVYNIEFIRSRIIHFCKYI